MNRKWISCGLAFALFAGLWTVAGCPDPENAPGLNLPPDPIETPNGPIKSIAVSPADKELYGAVKTAEEARANYRYRLTILQAYYNRIGNADKSNWAKDEMGCLAEAQWFRFEGLEQIVMPAGEDLTNADEATLVEYVATARKAWVDAMTKVASLYDQRDMTTQAAAVRRASKRLDPLRVYAYILVAEIPNANLRATDPIPAADAMFNHAYKLFREGKGMVPMFDTRYGKERQAARLFLQLIHDYPTSNKIALSAYYLGDIYKEYFNRNVEAVQWYERAWQWDKNITEPARFQAATVYDQRLLNYPKAVECYRAAIKDDPWRLLNREYARDRIKALTGREP